MKDDGRHDGDRAYHHHGDARDIIQAQAIHGDVNLVNVHRTRPRPRPRQLPPRPGVFRNQQAALRVLNEPMPPGPCRAVISGQPGSGKTALALHWVNLRRKKFRDGQIYLDLRGHDPARSLSAASALAYLLASIGADQAALPPDAEELAALWRTESYELELLVILDNAADADQVLPLLSEGPDTVTIITSRDALTELRFIAHTRFASIGPLDAEHSVALLRDLIEPLRGPLEQADLEELARLCGHLQLALVVAAQRFAKSPLTSLADLNAELREGERLFAPVRLVFGSAYASLDAGPARLFRNLGLAPAPEASLAAITALSGVDSRAALREVEALLGANLLSTGRPGRFVIHDLLHAYASELAWDADHRQESTAAIARLARWYTRTAREAAKAIGASDRPGIDPSAASSPDQTFVDGAAAHAWYTLEAASLTVLLRQLATLDLREAALEFCVALTELYELISPLEAWFETAKTGLDLATANGDAAREALFLESLGKAGVNAHAYTQALADHEAALALRTAAGDQAGRIRSLNALGILRCRIGNLEEAERDLRECLDLARSAGDGEFEIYAWMNLGLSALCRGRAADLDSASAAYRQALTRLDTALALLDDVEGMHFYRANALQDRAEALLALKRIDEAALNAAEAVRIARGQATAIALAPALRASALVKRAQGDEEGANADLLEAAGALRGLGDYQREAAYRAAISSPAN